MGKKSSKAPDVVGAARTEGEMSRATARDVTWADRPDQYNPMGSVTWDTQVVDASGNVVTPTSQGFRNPNFMGPANRLSHGDKYLGGGELPEGYTTKWTQSQNLNEGTQQLYDNQLGMMQGRSGIAAGMNDRVAADMANPADFDQFGNPIAFNPTDTGMMGYKSSLDDYISSMEGFDPNTGRQAAEDAAYTKATNRMDPYYEQQMQKKELDLRGKGLRPGDAAYDRAMSGFNTGRNDAYEQARLGASAEGRIESDLAYGQMLGSEQQRWNQAAGYEDSRWGQQQGRSDTIFGQEQQTNQMANALRQQQIDEYLGERGFSLAEQERVAAGQTVGDLAQNFSGGE